MYTNWLQYQAEKTEKEPAGRRLWLPRDNPDIRGHGTLHVSSCTIDLVQLKLPLATHIHVQPEFNECPHTYTDSGLRAEQSGRRAGPWVTCRKSASREMVERWRVHVCTGTRIPQHAPYQQEQHRVNRLKRRNENVKNAPSGPGISQIRPMGKSSRVRAGFRPAGSSAISLLVVRLSFFPPVLWMSEMHDIKWPIPTGTSKHPQQVGGRSPSLARPYLLDHENPGSIDPVR